MRQESLFSFLVWLEVLNSRICYPIYKHSKMEELRINKKLSYVDLFSLRGVFPPCESLRDIILCALALSSTLIQTF